VAVRHRALRVAARAIEHRLNRDTSDYGGPHLACRCGQMARYVDRRAKQFNTVLGELTLERAYYHCAACSDGFCPRDQALGLAGSALSPALIRMVGTVGAMVSFAEGSELLWDLAGVTVEAKQVERTAEALGQEIAADERWVVEPVPDSEIPPTLYLGMDGTGVPMRASEVAGRAGKQPDGSAKTREVKLCTVWSAESRNAEGHPVRDAGSVSYSAAIESAATQDTDPNPSAFAARVFREATRRGFDRAARRVVMGDGALWIWNLSDEQFPGAIQIVDRYHAKAYLSSVAQAIYGATSELAAQWAKARRDELDAGTLSAIVRALAVHVTRREARNCIQYLWRNRRRMRYPRFRARGLCTSTAVTEAGCKVTVGTRLKRAGMHWTVRGANAIVALRCCRLSGRFEDFWARRAQARAVA
jgi:hypothetical protein